MTSEADTPTTGIYEPLLPPFHPLTETNRGPIAIVTAAPPIVVALLTVSVKLWTVYGTTRRLGWNDYSVIASLLFGIGYTICIIESVASGLGKVEDELNAGMLEGLSKNYFAANILLILSLALAKTTVLLLVITIRPRKSVLIASKTLVGVVACWALASIIAVSVQCSPRRWVLGPSAGETCIDQRAVQIGIRATDVITDIATIVLPIEMMRSVQTSWSKKFMVVGLFSVRIITPITTIISIALFSSYYNGPVGDRPYRAITPTVWTSIALSLSIITACIPSIKRFLADWAAGLTGAAINDSLEMSYMSKSRSGNAPYSQISESRTGQLAARLGLKKSSHAEVTSTSRSNEGDKDNTVQARTSKMQRHRAGDTSDSVKGLTEGIIMTTKDYSIEYEEQESSNLDRAASTESSRERDAIQVRRSRV